MFFSLLTEVPFHRPSLGMSACFSGDSVPRDPINALVTVRAPNLSETFRHLFEPRGVKRSDVRPHPVGSAITVAANLDASSSHLWLSLVASTIRLNGAARRTNLIDATSTDGSTCALHESRILSRTTLRRSSMTLTNVYYPSVYTPDCCRHT